LSPTATIGSTSRGTTFSDIIINSVNATADGAIQGFSQFVHDPRNLKNVVQTFTQSAIPRKFAESVVLRRMETQQIDDIWSFPLNMTLPTTTPIPWTIVEAAVRSTTGNNAWEYNLMRTIDFIGRQYLRIVLPRIDTTTITDSTINTAEDIMSNAHSIYLGAWYRDLIPRLIEKVEFYPRAITHKLFEYSGYDIYIHNLLFGNAHKEMNDLMSGEDKYELCHDPYRVDGSALGIASYKGIDAFSEWTAGTQTTVGFVPMTAGSVQHGAQDGVVDYFQLDTTMDNEEFRNVYRRNVWYEAPVAQNYHARHSIHSRRMVHQAKDIIIPLDILPFGYSIASSLPATSIAGECGFIKIILHANWLDRAFYLTKLSDIPSLHPIVNHKHYAVNDIPSGATTVLEAGDPRIGWVNDRSVGRYGDPAFDPTDDPAGDTDADLAFTRPGNVINGTATDRRENIIPTKVKYATSGGGYYNTPQGKVIGPSTGTLGRTGNFLGANRVSTSNTLTSAMRGERLTDGSGITSFLHRMSTISQTAYSNYTASINVKLLQVGYQTMPCIREFLSKLPNIYITTEWKDDDSVNINSAQNFNINNDLYIQAIILWFLPSDGNIESIRMYPCHMIDHELPVIAGLKMFNEQSQGTIIYDWNMLNVLNPAHMGLNPLLENMGLISFSPMLAANSLPYAYYDSNVNGYLKFEIMQGDNDTRIPDTHVNLKSGSKLLTISIGINGVALVNLTMFRLVF